VIIFTVHVFDPSRKLIDVDVVKRRDWNEVERSAFGPVFTPSRRADAALTTELVVKVGAGMSWGRPVIFGLRVGARNLAKVLGWHQREPCSRFGANGTVTPSSAFAEVDVGLETHRAAMTTS